MLKKTLVACIMLLSTSALAESAPNCSSDKDGRILNGIVVSLSNTKYSFYLDRLLGVNSNYKIKLLSSTEISTQERKRLMIRRAKKEHYDLTKIKESGLETQYMKNKIYRQYYEVSIPEYPSLIVEYYSIPHYCGVDMESVYFVSDKIDGFTASFADSPDSPY